MYPFCARCGLRARRSASGETTAVALSRASIVEGEIAFQAGRVPQRRTHGGTGLFSAGQAANGRVRSWDCGLPEELAGRVRVVTGAPAGHGGT